LHRRREELQTRRTKIAARSEEASSAVKGMKIQDADRNDQRKASINKIEWLSRLSFFIFLTKMNNFLSLDQR
jgi:hypothetical protein